MTLRFASRTNPVFRSAATAALLGTLLLPTAAREAAANHGSAPVASANPFAADVPIVYQTEAPAGSDPTVEPPWDDFIRFLPMGISTLRLFVTADGPGAPSSGTTEGTACLPDPAGLDSDDVCAFNVTLEVAGNGRFVSFMADAGLAADGLLSVPPAGVFPPAQTSVSINYVNPGAPLAPGTFPTGGVHEIGLLDVEITGTGTFVSVTSGDSVRAVLAAAPGGIAGADPIPPTVIAVPEPGSTLLLVTGIAGLAGLHRLRMRRR